MSFRNLIALFAITTASLFAVELYAEDEAVRLLRESAIEAGLAVHVGATDGEFEIGLCNEGRMLVHGLSEAHAEATAARQTIKDANLLGRIAIEHISSFKRLPYAKNLVNLLVVDADVLGDSAPPRSEIMRVLAPGGRAMVKQQDKWARIVKKRPDAMDVWTHYNHGPDGNPVSHDELAQEPYGLRWFTSSVMGWGMFSVRATEGRVFLFWDTRTRWYDPQREKIRIDGYDAYSGVKLWSRYYPYPEVRKARPVAVGDRIFMLSGKHIAAIDAVNGNVLRHYEECETPYDAIYVDGVLICRNDEKICAFDAESGRLHWQYSTVEHPEVMAKYGKRRPGHFQPGFRLQMLVAGDGQVYFADHRTDAEGAKTHRIVGLNISSGKETWEARGEFVGEKPHPCFYANGVLFLVNENGYGAVPVTAKGSGWTMPVYGWKRKEGGRFSAFFGADVRGFLATNGLAWIKDVQRANLGGLFENREEKPFKGWVGIDPLSGEIKKEHRYPSTAYWSGRCYPDVGMPGRILAENMEIVDLEAGKFRNFRAARGQCGSGFIIANGLIYTNPLRCVSCYPMLRGATALCGSEDRGLPVSGSDRLECGPIYESVAKSAVAAGNDEWPMYRRDALRTSTTAMKLPDKLELLWTRQLSERATAPVIAGGKVFAAIINQGLLQAFDANNGKLLWEFTAAGRIDTPPTIYGPLCIFGCHDGSVYCLRSKDGTLVWRFIAEPEHRRIVAYERVESPWPVLGSVLIHNDVAYCIAGRLTRVDGGMHMYAINPWTGRQIWHKHLPGIYGDKATVLPHSWYIDEEHMLNNLLLAKDERLRIYDQYGGWQFSMETGELEGQESDVSQPGWPKGRRTPKNNIFDQRWPWCGWDRVTASELLAGEDVYNSQAVGMAPDRRGAGSPGRSWLFPREDDWGIYSVCDIKQEKFTISPVFFGKADMPTEELPWQPRTLKLDLRAKIFTDDGKRLVIAGGMPFGPHAKVGQLRVVSMVDGTDMDTVDLPGPPNFDGIAAAHGCIYVTTTNARLLCLGE